MRMPALTAAIWVALYGNGQPLGILCAPSIGEWAPGLMSYMLASR